MNKLPLPGTVWLASDIHLGPQTPKTTQAFLQFLSKATRQASALLLGGDIFNVWVGDDIVSDPPAWLTEILDALRQTSPIIPVYVCRGNRDFLISEKLCENLGLTLLHDQTLLETAAGKILFSHGDEYCTDDHGYQRFRYWVRKPWLQHIFLSFSLARRQKWAGMARTRSIQANQCKPYSIMDINENAVRAAFKRASVSIIVHGHTHRPAIHTLTTPAGELKRVVLPDWDYDQAPDRGGWLEITREGSMRLMPDSTDLAQPQP